MIKQMLPFLTAIVIITVGSLYVISESRGEGNIVGTVVFVHLFGCAFCAFSSAVIAFPPEK